MVAKVVFSALKRNYQTVFWAAGNSLDAAGGASRFTVAVSAAEAFFSGFIQKQGERQRPYEKNAIAAFCGLYSVLQYVLMCRW